MHFTFNLKMYFNIYFKLHVTCIFYRIENKKNHSEKVIYLSNAIPLKYRQSTENFEIILKKFKILKD